MTKYCIVVLLILSLALTAQISAQGTAGQESLQKGIDSLAHNDFALAEHCFVDSYNSAVKEGNGEVMTLSLSMLGDLHAFFSSYTVARRFLSQSAGAAQRTTESSRQSLSASRWVHWIWMAGNYQDSLRYFEKVDKEADDTVPPLMKVRALTFEGSSFTTLKEYSRA